MKILLSLFILFSFSIYGENCNHTATSFKCVKYLKNYDADTVTFSIPSMHPIIGKKINIKVLGIDTPEIRTKDKCEKEKARNAKRLVKNLLKNAKRIDLIDVKRGKYFRIVADVIIDGISLNNYLLKNGLAYSYDGGKKKKMNWCRSTRDIANENANL